MRHHTQTGPRAGFSLVEMLIVAVILSLALGMLSMIGQSSERAYQTGTTAAQLEQQTSQAVDRIVVELRPMRMDTMEPPLGGGVVAEEIVYMQALDYEAGQVLSSSLRRLALEYVEGEIDDGQDNNSNGMADECMVVLTEDLGGPSERRLVLTRWVTELFEGELPNGVDDNGNSIADERGFHVERNGDTLFVRLTLQRPDTQRRVMTRTARTSVEVRN